MGLASATRALRSRADALALDQEARAASAGDRAAFERFYRSTSARVATLAHRLLGPARAEDGVQEVYLRTWRKLASWRGEGSAGAWLERLARNTLIHLLARRGPPMQADEEQLVLQAAPRAHPELRLDLEAAIAALPEGARAVFVLHDVEGLKHDEIAALLGVTAGTSKSQLHRARMLLRAALHDTSERGRTS